ncbi:hypothetical protein QUF64_06885, partial [Anaerolineales bacterium HSG6]|nr:hypothetical protein [Anaerolineales bacterium HSG6]
AVVSLMLKKECNRFSAIAGKSKMLLHSNSILTTTQYLTCCGGQLDVEKGVQSLFSYCWQKQDAFALQQHLDHYTISDMLRWLA